MSQSTPETDSPRHDSAIGWISVWSTLEGRILLVGLILGAVTVLAILVPWPWNQELHGEVLTMSVTHLFFGRAAAMSMGYAQNLGQMVVIGVNLLIEIILVLVLFPLFVLSFRRLPLSPRLQRAIDRAQIAAEKQRALVHRFGMAGLFLFVWAPFWMTGPVVGSFLGHLMGLPLRINLGIVLGGTTVAILGWAFFLSELSQLASRGGEWGPVLFVVAVVAAVLLGRWLRRRSS